MEIRSFGDKAAPKIMDGRTIEGYAVVFGQESRVIFDKPARRCFVEVIEPGAITEDTLRECDVKALLEHNRERMLARSRHGSGSLSLSVDAHGVKYRFDAPNTPDGEYVVEMVGRGDMFGSSFAYTTDERNVRYTKRPDGTLLRSVGLVNKIYDVSPVSDPAYMGTDVSVRSIEGYMEPGKGDDTYKGEVKELRNLSLTF